MNTYIVKVPVSGKVEIVPFDEGNSYNQIKEAVGGWIESALIPHVKSTGGLLH